MAVSTLKPMPLDLASAAEPGEPSGPTPSIPSNIMATATGDGNEMDIDMDIDLGGVDDLRDYEVDVPVCI